MTLARVGLTVILGLIADQSIAQAIQGTATYRERMSLPPAAVFEATLEDVSRADAPATVVATTRVPSPGQPPIAFSISYDQAKIVPDHRYVVRARILLDGKLLFSSDVATPVITAGNPSDVSMTLRRVGAAQTKPGSSDSSPASRPLEGTYWKAVALAGKPVPAQAPTREAHLVFQAGGPVSGSDGCNRITGSYDLKGDRMTFGRMVGTQMACTDTGGREQEFRSSLEAARRWTIAGDRLELFDEAGTAVAAFEGRIPAPSPVTTPSLQGTAWQLVRFQGGDDTRLTPDDPAKYTIEFGAGNSLTARIDCNRGRGTWKVTGTSQLELGPLALTRAQCPEGSLHDQLVKQWGFIRSFLIKDRHLFLALMADGGIYEFEPLAPKQP